MKKYIISGVLLAFVVGGVLWMTKSRGPQRPKSSDGSSVDSADQSPKPADLQVVSHSPEAEDLPISLDGITVMFDRAMVPLTTLDQGRDQKIDLEISPKVEGKFFWLGTHGFIFRPEKPFPAATTFQVTLPTDVKALDGAKLAKPLTWKFSTVRPRLLGWSIRNNQLLLPKKAIFSLNFNISMNREDVEKNLQVIDSKTGQPLLTKKEFVWQDNDHQLFVKFKEEIPWDANYQVKISKAVRGAVGDLSMKEDAETSFSTPSQTLSLTQVSSYDYSQGGAITINPNEEQELSLGTEICYNYNQPIESKSFEKAFHVDSKKAPYYFFRDNTCYTVKVPGKDGHQEGVEDQVCGYSTACVQFTDDYNIHYHFSVNSKLLKTVSGAAVEVKDEKYAVNTGHASPNLYTNIKKTILSSHGLLKIPYRFVNQKSATVRLYRLSSSKDYVEYVKDFTITRPYDGVEKRPLPETIKVGNMSVPVDWNSLHIDSTKMSPAATQQIPLNPQEDIAGIFEVDLRTVNQGKDLTPGYYLVEVFGNPLKMSSTNNEDAEDTGVYTPVGSTLSILQVTPIGIALKRELGHVMVWATDLETGNPMSQLPIQLKFMSGQHWDAKLSRYVSDSAPKIKDITTNEEGLSVVSLSDEESQFTDFCAEVLQPGSESYTCMNLHQLNYSSILSREKNYFAYVHTDRPIYRPGHKVYFSSFIREVREGHYFSVTPDLPCTAKIVDSSGEEIWSAEPCKVSEGGVVSGEYDLEDSEDLPRGKYYVHVTVGQQSFTRSFSVASYRKPSFKVDLETPNSEIVNGDALKVDVKGSYFFGAPMRKAKSSWSIMTTTYDFSPAGYQEYTFLDPDLLLQRWQSGEEADYPSYGYEGDYYSEYEYDTVASSGREDYDHDMDSASSESQAAQDRGSNFFKDDHNKKLSLLPASLDENGVLHINYTPNLKKYPTSQRLTVEANVEDSSNQQVSGAEDIIVHKSSFYLGIKPEKWVYGEKEKAAFKAVSLDTQGKPLGGKSFKASLVQRDYQFIEKRGANGSWTFSYEPKDTEIESVDVKTDGEGKADFNLQIPKSGTYRVVIKSEDEKKNTVQSATTIYAWGSGYAPWRLDEPQTIELVPDKDSYKVGETAKILIKSLVPVSKALMTLERGHVLDHKIINLGGLNAPHIEVPITEGMIPNLYLSLIAHAGRHEAQPPMLFKGETEIHVEPERRRLQVSLTPDRVSNDANPPVYRPGDKVKVHVETKDATGKPQKAHVIVTVADESVLRLLNYQLPDLIKIFFYNRANSVHSSSSLISLKAGDGGDSPLGVKKRKIFKDTAHFESHLLTNDQGQGDFSFTLPDDLTTWVVEAVAITDSKSLASYESERQAKSDTPKSQSVLGVDLSLSDNTFVGGQRTKVMTTLPLLLRPALPRFAAWGDKVMGKIIANNQNPTPVTGKIIVKVGGSGRLEGDKESQEIELSVPARSESVYPVSIDVNRLNGQLQFSAEAKDAQGKGLDGLEISLPVLDRFAPEVVSTSGTTQASEKEELDIPQEITGDKGGLDISVKASMGLAVAKPMRNLLYYPYACSEQHSAKLLADLMARDMTQRFGDQYFDSLFMMTAAEAKKYNTLEKKLGFIDDQINTIISDLESKYQNDNDGGMKYWPESLESSLYPSAQVLWAFVTAKQLGYEVNDIQLDKLKSFIFKEMQAERWKTYKSDLAYFLWALNLDKADLRWIQDVADDLLKSQDQMGAPGLSYLLMALRSHGDVEHSNQVAQRLASLAKQEPRHTSWDTQTVRFWFYWTSPVRDTALATLALLENNPQDPLIPRALAFLFNRKKVRSYFDFTQNDLMISWMAYRYTSVMKEDETSFKGLFNIAGKNIFEKNYDLKNILEVGNKEVSMKELKDFKMPAEMVASKEGKGTLYYDLVLKYYLPPALTPTREEGLIISREYYDLNDVKEEHPLTEFKVGENYKGHITLVVPQEMNYVFVQDLLPAGFEPVDMTLATTSKALEIEADQEEPHTESRNLFWGNLYDDVVGAEDYGDDFGFTHQEIHDDSIIWSDEYVPAGVYHIRYPVRATTAGEYLMSGATAFEFYEPEIFGRSRGRNITIKSDKK